MCARARNSRAKWMGKKQKRTKPRENASPIQAKAIRQHCIVAKCNARFIKKLIDQCETANFVVPPSHHHRRAELLAFLLFLFNFNFFLFPFFFACTQYYSLQLIYSLRSKCASEQDANARIKSRQSSAEHIVAYY